jgi:hypothetical protein
MLAVECLRDRFTRQPSTPARDGESLFDFLSGYAGTVSGTSEPLSEHSAQRFTEGQLEKQRLRRRDPRRRGPFDRPHSGR